MKFNYILALIGTGLVMLCGAFIKSSVTVDDFDRSKREIMLREIGHRVLLSSGDSTSRVLPVVQLTDDEYQLQFDKTFTFQTDSLVKIINVALSRNDLATDYIVNVVECDKPAVLFGYAILNTKTSNKKGDKQSNIIPCRGRHQPEKCYRINIKFQDKGLSQIHKSYMLGSLPLLAFVGLLVYRSGNHRKRSHLPKMPNSDEDTVIKLGSFIFNVDKRLLSLAGTETTVTAKEARILHIFATAPNEIIDRRRLQKEIWEDEGVIVGRSLDMFISKLRKKLKDDPSLNLVNIHGKGYRLEVKS